MKRSEAAVKDRVRAVWQAFAAGDACGMPTEFMCPEDIRKVFGDLMPGELPEGILPAERSLTHGILETGAVTDDTEQNLYLLAEAKKRGGVTLEGVLGALEAWIAETGAVEKHYIGPSSLKALESIRKGTPAAEAGMGGTTCGGIMRTPSAFLWKPEQSEEELEESILTSLLPTHNTSEALEAAGAYGFALKAAFNGGSVEEIFEAAERGGKRLIAHAAWTGCAPSSVRRIREARKLAETLDEEELLDHVYNLWGTGLPSADVCGAVFALFALAGGDVWKVIRLATVIGGDTDTIAALAAALSAAYAGGHNIPDEVLEKVFSQNRELFEAKYPEALEG